MPQNTNPSPINTIYIIRHGQTDFNLQGIVQGSGINSELNETGHIQAQQFFEHYKSVSFSKIFTSSLQRTHQTVAPFTQIGIPMHILTELDEINWGIMEGAKPTVENTELFMSVLKQWQKGDLDVAVEGGETPNQLFERQKLGLIKINEHSENNPTLVCMHGRAMRSFLCLLTGNPLHKMDDFAHDNVCLYILEKSETDAYYSIQVANSKTHLIS